MIPNMHVSIKGNVIESTSFLSLSKLSIANQSERRSPHSLCNSILDHIPTFGNNPLFDTFVPGKLPIFWFIINKFIISNLVLHNPGHKLTQNMAFWMKWSARLTWVGDFNLKVGVIGQVGGRIWAGNQLDWVFGPNYAFYELMVAIWDRVHSCRKN